MAYIAANKLLFHEFNPFSLTHVNVCRSDSPLNVMKIQPEKSSAPILLIIMCYLPLHFHDKVAGGGCTADFWRNTGSETVLGLSPSFLLLTPLVSPQSLAGLQSGPPAAPLSRGFHLPLHTALTGSELCLSSLCPSLPLLCLVQLFHPRHQERVASQIFQRIKRL